jgi:hypothetical protein
MMMMMMVILDNFMHTRIIHRSHVVVYLLFFVCPSVVEAFFDVKIKRTAILRF